MRASLWRTAAVIALGTLVGAATGERGAEWGCGPISVADLVTLTGGAIDIPALEQVCSLEDDAPANMLDLKNMAASQGLTLAGVAAAFGAVNSSVIGPSIIHLNDPAHFLVMARVSSEWVQILDGGRVRVVPRLEIEKRYSGHALILDQSQFPDGGARLEVPD